MAQATLTRNEEKATNTETIADANEAQVAVGNALTVLRAVYLIQRGSGIGGCLGFVLGVSFMVAFRKNSGNFSLKLSKDTAS